MTIDREKERKAFEEWFDRECPTDAVAVRMHEEDAIDYLNAMMPIRYKRYAWDAWQARAEKDAARIAELEAKLAAIEAQEPVAWFEKVSGKDVWFLAYSKNSEAETKPLYLAPLLRELTDEDVFKLDERFDNCVDPSTFYTAFTKTELLGFARAIERHLKGGE